MNERSICGNVFENVSMPCNDYDGASYAPICGLNYHSSFFFYWVFNFVLLFKDCISIRLPETSGVLRPARKATSSRSRGILEAFEQSKSGLSNEENTYFLSHLIA